MDLLSDILQDAGLRRRVLGLRAIPADVALRFPCDKSIGLHVVVLWGLQAGLIRRAIEVGDLRDQADAWNNMGAIEVQTGSRSSAIPTAASYRATTSGVSLRKNDLGFHGRCCI